VARLDNRPRTAVERVALLIATVGGVGHAPFAPGTAASAVTALGLGLAAPSPPTVIVFALAVVFVGTWAAHDAERTLGGKDPGAIVIDEVAGMALSVVAFPPTPAVLLAGFALFRVFDVVKPYPANALQRLRGGVGVMIDDVVAGFYALVVLLAARALVGWP
jgi:phosphatidylglycerophosphatase A